MAEVRHGHTHLAYFTTSENVVGVVSGLGGEVEGNGQTCLTFCKVGSVQLVGRGGSGMARVGAH